MAQDQVFQQQVQRIGELVERLETTADPNTRAVAKELMEASMALHGAALERMMELVSKEPNGGGQEIVEKFGHDELVSSVLLLYGLHPMDMSTRVLRALDKKKSYLETHGASAELVSIGDDGTVTIRLQVKESGGCGSMAGQVKSAIEVAVEDAAPDATSIVVDEAGAWMRSGFVPLGQLGSRQGIEASFAREPRSGD